MRRNHGLILKPITPDHYVLGGLSNIPRLAISDGHWFDYIPQVEVQRKNVETMSCTSFGTLNAIEILYKKELGQEVNYSDRYLSLASGTTPEGNDPHKVCETLRAASGCVPEEMLPFSDDIKTFEQYHSPDPLTKKYYDEGRRWLSRFEFKHEWVPTNSGSFLEALTYSPLGVSVEAWQQDEKGYYFSTGSRDNHWTVLIDYQLNDHWLVYDSYLADGSAIKKLRWDYPFGAAKRFYLHAAPRSLFSRLSSCFT